MNEKIKNPKKEVPCSTEMNDCDYLNNVLEMEKNMSNNLSIALNEASNEKLFTEIEYMFDDVKKAQRELFEMSFERGWYTLEKENLTKIEETCNELKNKMNELELE